MAFTAASREAGKVEKASSISCRSSLVTSKPICPLTVCILRFMARWVRGVPRPEAEIARRIRQIVGPDIPIAGSFDLHGNEDEQFLQWANAAFVTKRYPHYDAALQGERSARFLYRSLRVSTTRRRRHESRPLLPPVFSNGQDSLRRWISWSGPAAGKRGSLTPSSACFTAFPGQTCQTWRNVMTNDDQDLTQSLMTCQSSFGA